MKRLFLSVSIIGAFLAPTLVNAATLSLTTEKTVVGVGSPFDVELILNAEYAVNAIEAALNIPTGFELENASDGNTIVSLWIEQPHYDRETHTLSFSGIIPGGFSGTGQLLKFSLKAEMPGISTLSFDHGRTTVYRNSPDGTLESTVLRTLTLSAEKGVTPALAPPADTEPPEAFTSVVTRDPQLYDGAWTLIFATQDKGSGIAQYEVSESPTRETNSNKLLWTKAESPYRLSGEIPARYIYVRAIDEQGNIRTELYTQERPLTWIGGFILSILVLALVLFVLWLLRKKRRHASP